MYDKLKYVGLLLLFCSCIVFSQAKDTVAGANKLELGISLSYYSPDLDDINKGFTRAENSSLIPLAPWNDFKVSYLVLPTIIYNLNRKNQIVVQVAGSYLQRARENTKSYYYVWMIGGEYRYMPYSWKKFYSDLYVSVGGGIIGSKFYRSYPDDYAIYISSSTFYINAGLTLSTHVISGIDLKTDVRYLFSPSKTLDNLKCDLSLKSVTAGIGVYFAL